VHWLIARLFQVSLKRYRVPTTKYTINRSKGCHRLGVLDDVVALEARTDGFDAVLQLAVLSISRSKFAKRISSPVKPEESIIHLCLPYAPGVITILYIEMIRYMQSVELMRKLLRVGKVWFIFGCRPKVDVKLPG
jgi:hypothetical protein